MPRPKGEQTTHIRISAKLKEEIEKYQKQGMLSFSEALCSMKEESEKLKHENISLKEENSKMRLKLEDYERLENEGAQNLELRVMLNAKAKEFKFVRDTIEKEINRILEMDSMLNIKIALRQLKEAVNTKVDFELEIEKESF